MVPVWMILSDLWPRFQGHDITQRQITQKRYQIELYLQWRTNRKSYMVDRTAPFFNDLERSLPQVSRSRHSLTLNIWETVRHTDSVIEILIGTYTRSHALRNSVISNDIEWLSKIFNGTKRRAVSLRQLRFLFSHKGTLIRVPTQVHRRIITFAIITVLKSIKQSNIFNALMMTMIQI